MRLQAKPRGHPALGSLYGSRAMIMPEELGSDSCSYTEIVSCGGINPYAPDFISIVSQFKISLILCYRSKGLQKRWVNSVIFQIPQCYVCSASIKCSRGGSYLLIAGIGQRERVFERQSCENNKLFYFRNG